MTDKKYKFDSIDKNRIDSAARKALMAADSQYHAWPTEQQERFRATMNEASRAKIQRVLLHGLLNIQCSDEEADDAWDDVTLPKLNALNWARLLTSGIGEDYLYLNESMADDKSLLDFTTLYDYDYDNYLFQEKAWHRDIPNYEGSDYYAYRHASWVRLLINSRFYYATFLSLATHLTDKIEEAGNNIIEQLIPHKYFAGKNNGKPVKEGVLWDMQIDADGQENQLDELKNRWYRYLQERWLILSKLSVENIPAVYTQDKNWDDDPQRFFIFNNDETLKKIRWRYFLSDCKPLMGNYSIVTELIEQEVKYARDFLTGNNQDIMTNLDPKIIKLRRKRKIVMTAGALDELNKVNPKDEPCK